MKFPGFKAEASLYRTNLHYIGGAESALAQASVLPLFITRCPPPPPPTVQARWQPDGRGGGTVFVTGQGWSAESGASSTVQVELITNCRCSTPIYWGYVGDLVSCSPWTGCCGNTFLLATIPAPAVPSKVCPGPFCGPGCQGYVHAYDFNDPSIHANSPIFDMPC